MTDPGDALVLPSVASALLQLAPLKAGISEQELADRAVVPIAVISAYEGDQRQPSLATLMQLLRAGGFDLRLHLSPCDRQDEILASRNRGAPRSCAAIVTGRSRLDATPPL